MITVKMLGGARKAFGTESVEVDRDKITIYTLLQILDGQRPDGAAGIEPANTLVAINGAEISAMGGMDAVVRSGDTVSIVPVVHGGATRRKNAAFEIGGTHLEAYWVGRMDSDAGLYIDSLRADHPGLVLQAVSSGCVLGASHVQKIAAVSLRARKKNLLLAKKLETDILLRFAGTTQISRAIEKAGAKSGKGFVLLSIGSPARCKRLRSEIESGLGCPMPAPEKVAKEFGIGKMEKEAAGRGGLEGVLAERAAVLV